MVTFLYFKYILSAVSGNYNCSQSYILQYRQIKLFENEDYRDALRLKTTEIIFLYVWLLFAGLCLFHDFGPKIYKHDSVPDCDIKGAQTGHGVYLHCTTTILTALGPDFSYPEQVKYNNDVRHPCKL